ncbi:dehydrogenase with different specificitie [Delitschia confertaspora ATCC 74209]|uniref:Dehydrogenase with different specificitie n=1 Tax=Delitschia confertaspora ATCC 74209 TaxID=1513339 RepID=A0A9P4JU43_9PLEO|nr:dehydrogenase with different specificitie [Delitschia confertaspora ATCC 74209]
MPSVSLYNPSTDIPDLSGKVILITGGTTGLGAKTILQLASHLSERILFTGRNASAASNVIASAKAINANLSISFIFCDFTSFVSVKDAALRVPSSNYHLDVLMCNAGVMALPKAVTKEGYELQMGVNHLAHALFIKTLLPLLLSTAKLGNDIRAMGAYKRYGRSKLANILYTQQLAIRYPSITSISIHPGVINTGLITGGGMTWFNKLFIDVFTIGMHLSVEGGAKIQLWAAMARKEELVNGGFYEPVGEVGRTTEQSRDERLAERLWEWTERELAGY